MKTDTSNRSRSAAAGAVPTSSTVFRNSNKQKTSRHNSSERNAQSNRTLKPAPTTNTAVYTTALAPQQATTQRPSNSKGVALVKESYSLTNSNVRISTVDTCGVVTTTELESSLNLGKDFGIVDPSAVSVILNGPIGSGDLLTNHVKNSVGSSKSFPQAPSPRGSYVIPVSPSSPAPGVYSKNSQVSHVSFC